MRCLTGRRMNTAGITARRLASTSVLEELWTEPQPQKQKDDNERSTDDQTEGSVLPSKPEQAETIDERGSVEDDTGVVDTDESFDDSSDGEATSTSCSIASSKSNCTAPVWTSQQQHVSCIQETQLSPDGRCIFTSDYDRTFSTYIIDNDILAETRDRALKPYARFASADPIWAFAANPQFDINNDSTTTIIVSRRDQYITLHNALWDLSQSRESQEVAPRTGPVDISTRIASYKLVDHLTENVLAPTSLTYSSDGAYFYAGHQNSISVFDLTYTNDPIFKIATIPSARNKRKGGGVGFKGQITALALSPFTSPSHPNLFAAGSRTRYIGLYDGGSGAQVTHFALPGNPRGKRWGESEDRVGDGVTQLKWSPDGNYLYIAERSSSAIHIYDVRNYSFSLGYCASRNALTRQKMGFDLWNNRTGHEVWAGGTDGKVRFWRDPYMQEGAIEPDGAVHVGDGPVCASLVHSEGNLAVVASGTHAIDGDGELRGKARGGGLTAPSSREWGRLDILGLTDSGNQ